MMCKVNEMFNNAYEQSEDENIIEKITKISTEIKKLCYEEMEVGKRKKKP